MRDTARLVFSEWRVVCPRVTRTRLWIWLLAIPAVSLAVAGGAGARPQGLATLHATLALWSALLGGVAMLDAAGSDEDRLALRGIMTHPTTPVAVALGRWLAAVTIAGGAYLVAAAPIAARVGGPAWGAVGRGLVPLAAIAALMLAAAWAGGTGTAGGLALLALVPGALDPAALATLLGGSKVAGLAASTLHGLPTFIRARGAAAGRGADLLLCAAWVAVGLGLATWRLAARRAWPGPSA